MKIEINCSKNQTDSCRKRDKNLKLNGKKRLNFLIIVQINIYLEIKYRIAI